MPQNRAGQTTGQRGGDAVFAELRGLIDDVRSWHEAMPIPSEPILSDIEPAQDAAGSSQIAASNAVAGVTPDTARLAMAAATLDDHAGTLAATAEHAAQAVRERGDRIDAMLAEIRRIRAETVPA